MYSLSHDTPIGKLVIKANDQEVFFVGFPEEIPDDQPNPVAEYAMDQLKAYFDGKRYQFDFPLLQPGTNFQQRVWKQLMQIPAGNPISYAALSRQLSNPLAIRAIASANGKNNLMIVVPCHRVIGSNGDLVGFSAGLWRKKWLLDHEAKMLGIGQTSLVF